MCPRSNNPMMDVTIARNPAFRRVLTLLATQLLYTPVVVLSRTCISLYKKPAKRSLCRTPTTFLGIFQLYEQAFRIVDLK